MPLVAMVPADGYGWQNVGVMLGDTVKSKCVGTADCLGPSWLLIKYNYPPDSMALEAETDETGNSGVYTLFSMTGRKGFQCSAKSLVYTIVAHFPTLASFILAAILGSKLASFQPAFP